MEFYAGATKLGEAVAAPYNFNWSNAAAGTYSVTARATDDTGVSTTSLPVSVIVNQPLTVALIAPANGASFYRSGEHCLDRQCQRQRRQHCQGRKLFFWCHEAGGVDVSTLYVDLDGRGCG